MPRPVILLTILFFLVVLAGAACRNTPTVAPAAPPIANSRATAVPTATATVATATATETAPATVPTQTVTASPTRTPTAQATPTASPTLQPTPTPTSPAVATGPDWLIYLNRFRAQAALPPLAENSDWSEGSRLHSIYMVNTDQLWHDEHISSPWYTKAGQEAAKNGNIAASDWMGEPAFTWAIDFWMSAPFHAVPILDPALGEVGFGTYREEVGVFVVTAAMDVGRGIGEVPAAISFPVTFPADGGQTWVLSNRLGEFPNPLESCPGYQRPTGPPLILQIGDGSETPAVTSTRLIQGEIALAHCVFDETNYVNDEDFRQGIGREILNERDAIVILPRRPLEVGNAYTVTVTVNGQTVSWRFEAVAVP